MKSIQVKTATPTHKSPKITPQREVVPETPKRTREELLEEFATDSFENSEEYLNNSVTPQGE